jgi:hypothetical protein
MRQNSNFHLLKEAYRQVLRESALPPVGPGVCYFETETGDGLRHRDVVVKTSTGKWEFVEHTGIMSTKDGKTPSGSIIGLGLGLNQITSFDGSSLSGLTHLNLNSNRLTSFDGSGLSGLTHLDLYNNQITSFDGSGLSALEELDLSHNQLSSFDGSKLNSKTSVWLDENPFHNLNGPAVVLPNGTEEYWIEGKKYKDEHEYEVARAKYLSPQEADKAMEEIGLKGLFDDI